MGNSLAYEFGQTSGSIAVSQQATELVQTESSTGMYGLRLGTSGEGLRLSSSQFGLNTSALDVSTSNFELPENVQALNRRDDLADFVTRTNSFIDEQSSPILVAGTGSMDIGRRILNSESVQKLRELSINISGFIDEKVGLAVDKYNGGIAAIRDIAVDIAASDPTAIKQFAAHLATKTNELIGQDAPFNAMEIVASPAITASGVIRGAAQITGLPELLDSLGDIKLDRNLGNPAIRKVLGEAVELGLRVEQAGEGIVRHYLKRTGRLMEGFGTGTGAEFAVQAIFQASKLFSEVTFGSLRAIGDKGFFDLKNHSDNGIDILVREKDSGKYVGFEVKASVGGIAPRLRGGQQDGAAIFILDRLERIANDRSPFTPGRVLPGTKAYAESVLVAQGKNPFTGYVVKVTNFGKPSVSVDMMNQWTKTR